MMTNYKAFVGIDVSMATLDISLSGKHFKIKNERSAIFIFIQKEITLKKIVPTLVCLESTGGYERVAMQCFQETAIPIHRAHPNKVHSFAKASGHFAKTDKLDAKLLEKYATFVSDKEKGDEALSVAAYELQGLRSIEIDLLDDLHANNCRIKISSGRATKLIQTQINFINQQLKIVRKEMEKTIKSDVQLAHKYNILVSYKSVSIQTATALLADLPELGTLNNKAVASLVGVAPKLYESGTKKLSGHIMGGRFYARKAVYMAALVASQHNKGMKSFYNRLVEAGKPKKVALVALMRKIIICLNVMIKNDQVYDECYTVKP